MVTVLVTLTYTETKTMNHNLLDFKGLLKFGKGNMTTMTEDVIAAQRGNMAAFGRLINATRNTVTSVALSIVRDVDVSEDIAQQAYINCWKNIGTLKNSHSFLPWLRQSTRYMAINYLRDNKVSTKVAGEEAEQIFAQFSSDQDVPETVLSIEQQKVAVGKLLETLPDESREIVTLYYREEQSTARVAELLGLSEAGVRKKLSRARSSLKEKALTKFGKALLSTAPAISFTSLVLSSLVFSPKATAGVTAVSHTSWWTKLTALFSGAVWGTIAAAFAIMWSHNIAEKKLSDESIKKRLNKLKYLSVGWMFISALILGTAFHFSDGAWAPISAYALFAAGFFVLTKRTQALIYLDMETNPGFDTQSKQYRRQKFWGALGLYGGFTISAIAMLLGLHGSGRL